MRISIKDSVSIMKVCNDNEATVNRDNRYHKRTRHLHIRFKRLYEAVLNNEISLHHVTSNEDLADVLTKPFSKPKLHKAMETLGQPLINWRPNSDSVDHRRPIT